MNDDDKAGTGGDDGSMDMDTALRESLAELDKTSAAAAPSEGVQAGGAAAATGKSTTDSAPGAAGDDKGTGAGADRGDGRDAAGRFVKKQGETDADFEKRKTDGAAQADVAAQAAAAAAKPGQDAAQQTAGAQAAAAAAPQPEIVDGRDITKAPNSWKPEAGAGFDKLPKAVREEIHRREEAMFKGLENYKGAATFGTELAKQFHPYSQMLKAIHATPADIVNAALKFEYGIRTAKTPEAKLEYITNLARSYGVALPGASAPAAGDGKGGAAAAQPDPVVAALQNQVRQLTEKLNAREQAETQQREQEEQSAAEAIRKEISDFAADPKNEFWDKVKDEVLAFVRQGLDLKPAYDKAIWANSVTRATLIARQQEAERKEAAEKAAAANRANVVNVTARATPQGKTAGKGTWEDTLRAELEAVGT